MAACGSSSTTSTAPATLPRCGVTIGVDGAERPGNWRDRHLAMTTARECAWTASSNAPWLTLRGTPSGQGDGVVEYVAVATSDPDGCGVRVIELNDQRANVTQSRGRVR